jgi:hypothetical protein
LTTYNKRFQTYHEVIKWIVDPDKTPRRDRQTAAIYELRNFPKYFNVSKRILKGLRDEWAAEKKIPEEIDLAISYMEKNWVQRLFIKK